MNQVAFVIAAYAVTFGGTAALLLGAWLRMRAAERAAEALKARK